MMVLSIEEDQPYLFEVPSTSMLQDESLQNAQEMLMKPNAQNTSSLAMEQSLLSFKHGTKAKPKKSSNEAKPSNEKS